MQLTVLMQPCLDRTDTVEWMSLRKQSSRSKQFRHSWFSACSCQLTIRSQRPMPKDPKLHNVSIQISLIKNKRTNPSWKGIHKCISWLQLLGYIQDGFVGIPLIWHPFHRRWGGRLSYQHLSREAEDDDQSGLRGRKKRWRRRLWYTCQFCLKVKQVYMRRSLDDIDNNSDNEGSGDVEVFKEHCSIREDELNSWDLLCDTAGQNG